MGGTHVAMAHAIAGLEDVDPLTLGRRGVRSTQHVCRDIAAQAGERCSLLDEVVGTEPSDPLTRAGRLRCREKRTHGPGRALQHGKRRARVYMQLDRLAATVPKQLGIPGPRARELHESTFSRQIVV